MNHDYAHCLDYQRGKCPNACFRARLTEDLKQRGDLRNMPMTWASFKGAEECQLLKEDKRDG